VRVIAVTTPLDESPESIILEGVLETFSEYYSANLSRVITRGMRQAVEAKASRPGGTVPYGFESVREAGRVTLRPRPDEAETVRRMIALIFQGHSLTTLRRQLQVEGLRNRSGKPFQKSQLHRILHNPALVGDLVWSRSRAGRGKWMKPVSTWLISQDAWTGIIDRDTFKRIQTMLAGRAPTDGKRRVPSSDYLLTGLLVCGRCGSGYTVEQAKSGRYKYYDCCQRRKDGVAACPGKRLPIAQTDRQVISVLLDWLFEERRVTQIVAWYLRQSGVNSAAVERSERELDHWETELTARRERILDALEYGKIDPDALKDRLAKLDTEKERLSEKRAELERLKAKVVAIPTVEMFRQIGGELRKRVEEGPRPAGMLLRRMIRRIIVSPTGSLNAELVIGTPAKIKGSADGFAISDRWWRWGESNPRPRTCQ